jgi:ornithine cyclodeaminase/alanine dehydrogenase-like protein (mu-crystallin family)
MNLLYLSRADVERIDLPMSEVIAGLEEMFEQKGLGRVEMPPKPGVHPLPDAFIHAMPAHIPALGATGLKWIAGYPQNQARGLPYITGLLILNDPETGVPTAVMDATWITAKRTGAATAVAAKRLARPESATVGIVACGVQGRSNLEALATCFDLQRVHAFDLRREVAERFAVEMGRELDLDVRVVDSARQAVEGLDLVVTSGPILKDPSPVIEAGWLAPGAFASAVDFDSYFQGAAMREVERLVTDDHAQLEHYRAAGYFKQTPAADADLGELVCGARPGRLRADERILCIPLGLALEDMATAIRIQRRALELGVGQQLPL